MWYVIDTETKRRVSHGSATMLGAENDRQHMIDCIQAYDPDICVTRLEVIQQAESAQKLSCLPVNHMSDVSNPVDTLMAQAVFDNQAKSIILQCGAWSHVFTDPEHAADALWEYCDASQFVHGEPGFDPDVPRFWDDWQHDTFTIKDDFFVLSLDDLIDVDLSRLTNPNAIEFCNRIKWLKDRDLATEVDGGWVAVHQKYPFIARWYDDQFDADNDPDVRLGRRFVRAL